jgi:hypothetical protein
VAAVTLSMLGLEGLSIGGCTAIPAQQSGNQQFPETLDTPM